MSTSPNRMVAIATPLVFAPLAGAITALAAKHAPGLEIDQGQLEAIFIAGATIALAKSGLWLKGWQDYEKREQANQAAAAQVTDDPYGDVERTAGRRRRRRLTPMPRSSEELSDEQRGPTSRSRTTNATSWSSPSGVTTMADNTESAARQAGRSSTPRRMGSSTSSSAQGAELEDAQRRANMVTVADLRSLNDGMTALEASIAKLRAEVAQAEAASVTAARPARAARAGRADAPVGGTDGHDKSAAAPVANGGGAHCEPHPRRRRPR